MSGPATSSSRRWVSLLSSSFAQCSEEAGVYGQCLAGKLTELEKGVCQKEFVQFNTCMQQAMKKGKGRRRHYALRVIHLLNVLHLMCAGLALCIKLQRLRPLHPINRPAGSTSSPRSSSGGGGKKRKLKCGRKEVERKGKCKRGSDSAGQGREGAQNHDTKSMTAEWLKLKAAEAGASLLQSKAPLGQVHLYLCALHFYSGDVKRQVEAHHYCSCINDEVHQCLIFDSNEENARLIGVEYVVSERLFKTLPEDEKKMWHSHHYEVKSGMLVLPGVPSVAEHKFMEGFIKTYGKVFHFWQVDRGDPLPIGPPRLMMALTADDQLDKGLLARVHGKLGIDTEACRKGREDIPLPEVDPGANSWEKGPAYQFELKEAEATTGPTTLPGAGVHGSSASL